MDAHRVISANELNDVDWESLNECIEHFERAWQNHPFPKIREFVHQFHDEGMRERVLLELIKVDQELRWEAGQPAELEFYLARWPELSRCSSSLTELLQNECVLRSIKSDVPSVGELKSRFPAHADEVDLTEVSRIVARESSSESSLETTLSHGVTWSFDNAVAELSLTPGQVLGRYQIRSVLGRGATGTVYAARDTRLNRDVALKIPQFANTDSMRRFMKEAQTAAQIRHPNICPIYDVHEYGGVCFISMALIEGVTLSEAIPSNGLPLNHAVDIVATLADALGEIHELGVVHRDIKPANVMLDTRGRPILMDFGLAHSVALAFHGPKVSDCDSAEFTKSLLGTPAYMSPEQARGESLDHRSDIYSLGALLFHLLTGDVPFSGTMEELLHRLHAELPTRPSVLNSVIPSYLDEVCLRALEKSAADRFETASDLAQALRRSPKATVSSRRRAIISVVTLSLLATLLLLSIFFGGLPRRDSSKSLVVERFEPALDPTIITPDGDRDVMLLAAPNRWLDVPRSDPYGICTSPDGRTLFVAGDNSTDGSIRAIDLDKGSLSRLIRVPSPPDVPPDQRHNHTGVTQSKDQRFLFLTNYYSTYITRIDLSTGKATQLDVGARWGTLIGTSPDGRTLVVVLGTDGRSKELDNECVALVDIDNDVFRVKSTVALKDEVYCSSIAFSKSSSRAYLLTRGRGNHVPAIASISLQSPFQVEYEMCSQLGEKSLEDLTCDGIGRLFVATIQGVKVFDAKSLKYLSEVDCLGYRPDRLALDEDEGLLFALSTSDRIVLAVDLETLSVVGGASRFKSEPATLLRAAGRVVVSHAPSQIAVLGVNDLLERIVFASDRLGGGYQLFMMAKDGRQLLQLTNRRGTHRSPQFCPGGDQIAFVSDFGGPLQVCVMSRDGSNLRTFVRTDPSLGMEGGSSVDWSPDGSQVAFIGRGRTAVRAVSIETGEVATLWDGESEVKYTQPNTVSWHDTRDTIVVAVQDPSWTNNQDIFELDPATGVMRQLTDEWDQAPHCFSPAVSPDGELIAVVRRPTGSILPRQIFVMSRSGGLRCVTPDESIEHRDPSWYPRGDWLLYSAGDGIVSNIFSTSAKRGGVRQHTFGNSKNVEPTMTRNQPTSRLFNQ